jgi:hypothetical protein
VNGGDADFQVKSVLSRYAWVRAWLEWNSYWGPLIATLIVQLAFLAWRTEKLAKQLGGVRQLIRLGKRQWLVSCTELIGKSLTSAGAGVFLIYLANLPAAIADRERSYQHRYAWLLQPTLAVNELESRIAAISTDVSLMNELRAEVKKAAESRVKK